ncbi:hypothetical protein Tco_1162857, partial [Tanacetum coccineum]
AIFSIKRICDFSHINEHLDTIPATESDEVIKSSVENLVQIPSESEGIPDNMCDVPFHDNSPPLDISKDQFKGFSDSNDDSTSSDDYSPYGEDIDGSTTTLSDYSLSDYEAFYLDDDHIEEKSSGSTTTHADFSQYDSFIFDLSINPCPPTDRSDCYHEEIAGELAHIISSPEYDCFYFKNEPDHGNFTMDVVEDIFDNPTREPRFHVPNVLPTHPTLHLDLDFTLSIQSMIFLSSDEFSFSFIRDPPLPVFHTFLPFSTENENKVVNTGILASEEKSPSSPSHWGFKASKLSHHKSLMLIHRDNTPNLGIRHPHFYPP